MSTNTGNQNESNPREYISEDKCVKVACARTWDFGFAVCRSLTSGEEMVIKVWKKKKLCKFFR